MYAMRLGFLLLLTQSGHHVNADMWYKYRDDDPSSASRTRVEVFHESCFRGCRVCVGVWTCDWVELWSIHAHILGVTGGDVVAGYSATEGDRCPRMAVFKTEHGHVPGGKCGIWRCNNWTGFSCTWIDWRE